MKRGALGTLVFVFLIAILAIVYAKRGLPGSPAKTSGSPPVKPEAQTFKTVTASPEAAAVSAAADAAAEQAALDETLKMMSDNLRPDRTPDALIESLTRTHQEPVVAHDKNEYTGEMTVIRTRNPAPGTRYFLAQFFSDDKGGSFPQHLSVEVRPGPDAFARAIESIHRAFPGLGEPDLRKSGFMQWNAGNGYVVWVKELGPDDIEDDGVNPHTAADIGTIWIAAELAPHDEGEN